MKKQSICIVTSIHPDFDSRIWKHARGLAAAGFDVHLICPWNVPDGYIRDGVRFHPFLPVSRRLARPFIIPVRISRKLLRVVRSIDIIHFHDIDIVPFMTLLSFFKRVVYDVHENYPDEMMMRYYIPNSLRRVLRDAVYWGQFICSMKIRNIVLVAPSCDSGFTNPHLRKVYVGNLASLELLKTVAPDYECRKPAVIFTGSQYLDNGTLLYLEIAEQCKDVIPDVPFYMTDRFASQEFRQQVLNLIKSRGLSNVQFLPNVIPHELMQMLNRATIGVLPSLRVPKQIKALRTKLFEYLAAGLPIVASDLPYEITIIGENDCGILAQPEKPQSFADAIIKLTRDRALAARLGKNGQRAFIEKYSWEGELPKLLAFYDRILQN